MPLAVCDLADGKRLPGVRIELSLSEEGVRAGCPWEATTDASGLISVCPRHLRGLHPEDPWILPARSPVSDLLQAGEVWLYRMVEIVGQVELDGEEKGKGIDLLTLMLPTPGFPNREAAKIGSTAWLASHQLDRVTNLPKPDEYGRFRVRVPAVKGLTIRARKRGRKPADVEVDVPSDPSLPAHVRLRLLEKPLRISGVVVDTSGNRLGGIPLETCLLREIPIEDVRPAVLRKVGHCYTAAGRKDGSAYVNYSLWGTTGRKGEGLGTFEMHANITGNATLVIYPPKGYRPFRLHLGNLSGDIEDLKVILEPDLTPQTVRILVGGIPRNKARVGFTDLTVGGGDLQPTFVHTTDSDGKISAHLFEAGHKYWFAESGSRANWRYTGWFRWNGQETIDVSKDLSRDL